MNAEGSQTGTDAGPPDAVWEFSFVVDGREVTITGPDRVHLNNIAGGLMYRTNVLPGSVSSVRRHVPGEVKGEG